MSLSKVLSETDFTNVIEESRDDHTLLIDGTNSFIRVFSSVPSLNDDGDHVGGVLGFLKTIALNIRTFNPTRCIIVFDGPGGSKRRKELFPDYKAGRKRKSTLNRFGEFEGLVDEKKSMEIQFSRILDYLAELPVTTIIQENIEADDVISYIANQYSNSKVTIISTDKDFLQMVDHRIQVYEPFRKILYTPEMVGEKFGLHERNVLLFRTIDGDNSDRIPGVKGVGIKSLIKYFPDLKEKEITINEFKSMINEMVDSSEKLPAVVKKLSEGFDIIDRNYKLMQLSDVNIPTSKKNNINRIMNSSISKLNKRKFLKMFNEDKLYSGLKDVIGWLGKSFNKLDKYAKKDK